MTEANNHELPERWALTPELAGHALMGIMSDISEDRYCARWYSGIEHILWREVVDDRADDLQTQTLRALAHAAGGWPAWAEGEGRVRIVPISEWHAMTGDGGE